MTRQDRIEALQRAVRQRILVLDGAMGTMVQAWKLDEAGYRGERLADWHRDLKGNNDILVLTRPEIVADIHESYLDAGADMVATSTFNGTSISQSDYGLEAHVHELNVEAARIARACADAASEKTPARPRFVAGAVGPTNRTASISPDVNDPAHRNVTWDGLVEAYAEQVRGLIEGGVDAILIETVFDTLNAKAAGFAVTQVFEEKGVELPVMVSGTITDLSGRNLSGQTPEAFWYSVRHLKPFSIGLNCAFGARQLSAPLADIAAVADCFVCAYPNAGLPNEMGEYDETPEETAAHLAEWAKRGIVNMVGGCCGTTPAHIREIAAAVAGFAPREVPELERKMRLSGLEPFVLG